MNKKTRNQDFKIMIVDDSALNRKTTAEILDNYGFNVVAQTGNATDVLRMGQTQGCKLYIIDIVMPEVSGLELAKILTDNFKGIYIIMMSSLDSERLILESISAGALDFLRKPFDENQLIDAVEKLEHTFIIDQQGA